MSSMRLWAGIALTTCLALLTAATPPKSGGSTTAVTIRNMSFSPASINIKAGDTVVWTNRDDQDHTVVANDSSFGSGNMKSGESYSYRFTKVGTISYGCSLHPRMKGAVVVAEAPK